MGWRLPDVGYEKNENDEVTLIFCKTCREFFSDSNIALLERKYGGNVKKEAKQYIDGTTVIKKIILPTMFPQTVHIRWQR